MFSIKQNVKSTLLCGDAEFSKIFLFEAAIYWAEEGRRVIFITPAQLESLPQVCLDKRKPAAATYKLMRFMYLPKYKDFAEILVELHTFASLPSVLLIDDFENYLRAENICRDRRQHIANTCALILDTMNACSKLLKMDVHVCAWSSSVSPDNIAHSIYFRNVLLIEKDDGGGGFSVRRVQDRPTQRDPILFKYITFHDGTWMLSEILRET